MKIWYSPYSLKLKTSANRTTGSHLKGFLLKIKTSDFAEGYADCLPWSIFGEESAKQQIGRLKRGELNELLVRSLYYATLDGQARAKKISLFLPDIQVRSHYTCADLTELTPVFLENLSEYGFETLKVKVGKNPQSEAKTLSKLPQDLIAQFSWRLDANSSGGDVFLKSCSKSFIKHIEFIEDPTSYSVRDWQKLEQKYSINIAWDQPVNGLHASQHKGVRVIKPARSSLKVRRQDVITNSMDHPVGQSFAFWEAQQCVAQWGRQPKDFGLKTNHLLKENDFSRELFDESPFFTHSEGYGIGFDRLLRKQKWIAL